MNKISDLTDEEITQALAYAGLLLVAKVKLIRYSSCW